MVQAIRQTLDKQKDIILTIFRVIIGIIFIQAGFGKLINLEKTAYFFDSINIIYPYANALLASIAELVCGLLLLIGFQTQLAACPLAFVMVVALFTAKSGNISGISDLIRLHETHYLLICLWFATYGGGRFSMDNFFSKNSNNL